MWSLSYWKVRLSRRDAGKEIVPAQSPIKFAPVRLVDVTVDATHTPGGPTNDGLYQNCGATHVVAEVVFAGGCVRVFPGACIDMLAKVVQTLKE